MTEWAGGKGSVPRPFSVSREKYEQNWDLIFKKKKTVQCKMCGKDIILDGDDTFDNICLGCVEEDEELWK